MTFLEKGLIAPILTPFNDDLSIANELYLEHAQHLLTNGCVALAPFGTTGEALSVASEQRINALRFLIDNGVNAGNLIPGTGLTNVSETAWLCSQCINLGCKAVMVLPPFYYKSINNEGLINYYRQLIDNIDDNRLKIILYHIPQVAGVGIPVEVVKELHEAYPSTVIGIKDSSGDFANTQALLQIESLIVYPGSELPLIKALDLGANGCISATANINSHLIAEVINLHRIGKFEQAKHLHEIVMTFREKVQQFNVIPALKTIVMTDNTDPRWLNMRPPFVKACHSQYNELIEFVAHFRKRYSL